METITIAAISKLLPPRDPDMHKGRAGRVLIAAGSPGMAGAAALCAGAALRSGAGLVYVSADAALWPVIQTIVPCAVCVGRDAVRAQGAAGYGAAAVGPGLGTDRDAADLVSRVIGSCDSPVVIDADALNIIAQPGEAQALLCEADAPRPAVMTPHPGEAARLLGVSVSEVQADRKGAAAEIAKRYRAVAVLKGRGTLVAAPPAGRDAAGGPEILMNTTGNPGMATAGSGDVLAGVIAAFAAQGMSARDAAAAGVFIHGLAGDHAADAKGEYGLIATDIIEALPYAIRYAAAPGDFIGNNQGKRG
jgi:NAD(P)H-hydrate epimerase